MNKIFKMFVCYRFRNFFARIFWFFLVGGMSLMLYILSTDNLQGTYLEIVGNVILFPFLFFIFIGIVTGYIYGAFLNKHRNH